MYDHLLDIAETWSQWTFCQETDLPQQQYVTQTLLVGLKRLKREDSQDDNNTATTMDSDELTLALLQGVTNRLESFQPGIRQDGMKVAQAVAQRLGQSLHFDELVDEEASSSDQKVENDSENTVEKSVEEPTTPMPLWTPFPLPLPAGGCSLGRVALTAIWD